MLTLFGCFSPVRFSANRRLYWRLQGQSWGKWLTDRKFWWKYRLRTWLTAYCPLSEYRFKREWDQHSLWGLVQQRESRTYGVYYVCWKGWKTTRTDNIIEGYWWAWPQHAAQMIGRVIQREDGHWVYHSEPAPAPSGFVVRASDAASASYQKGDKFPDLLPVLEDALVLRIEDLISEGTIPIRTWLGQPTGNGRVVQMISEANQAKLAVLKDRGWLRLQELLTASGS